MIARILGARNAAIIPDTSSARSLLAALWRCAIEHAPALDAITAALGLALVRAGVRPLSLHGPLLHRAHHNAVGTRTIHGDVELAGDVRLG